MYELHDYRFMMHIRGGGDLWCLSGKVHGRPGFDPDERVLVSHPTSYDAENDVITTYSGSKYKLVDPAVPKEEIVGEILNAIKNGGYEVH